MTAPRKPRRLRNPPPDTATVRFVSFYPAAPGQPKSNVELRAEIAVAAMLRLAGHPDMFPSAGKILVAPMPRTA